MPGRDFPGTRRKTIARAIAPRYRATVSVRFTILGSGSSGNCAYVETENSRVLVDAGFTPRQIRHRLATIGRTPENLSAIFITHEHADHVSGLFGLAEKLKIPIYCNRDTRDAIVWSLKERWNGKRDPLFDGIEKTTADFVAKLEWQLFQTGDSFELNDLFVETFPIPHDAQDPVGFLVRTCGGNFGFVTDLGHMTKLVVERMRAANVLLLESNHDVKMLQESRRSWSLKQRILGRHGHLSNEAAADAATQIMSAGLKHLYLAHLSRECNRPELAMRVMTERLARIGAGHVQLQFAAQDVPCQTLEL
ncbi:MAG TPA: MBL fold metallo-hydrolase [Alphaproteobacteria bacterium]|nr:MBL fold metallo-hydrolase [Alphaproteobacteria bacterium]